MDGSDYPADQIHGLSDDGWPLLVHYDLEAIKRHADRDTVWARHNGFWKWRELLPVRRDANVVALGEIDTPLIPIRGAPNLLVKDEGRLPTGSFKARGLALAVSMAKELGVEHLAMPTNGNAGAALSAYASRAGITSTVVCPDDTPEINIQETALQGATVLRANGLIHQCGAWVRERAGDGRNGTWFDVSTLKEPYRIEGKKTMGLELAAQLGWTLPDVIFYPTGGGTGLIGMWKAFAELEALGWLEDAKKPKMVAVQAEGCAPIVKAYEAGERHAPAWENASTIAAGIRVPKAIGDFLILDAVRESGGWAQAVSDHALMAARAEVAREDGLLLCPEGAACVAAYDVALADGRIDGHETAIVFNCATGLKYPMPHAGEALDLFTSS